MEKLQQLATNETWQQRMVAIVSHDRVILDEVSTDPLHVSGAARKLTQSRGNYSTWHKRREHQQLTLGREVEAARKQASRAAAVEAEAAAVRSQREAEELRARLLAKEVKEQVRGRAETEEFQRGQQPPAREKKVPEKHVMLVH